MPGKGPWALLSMALYGSLEQTAGSLAYLVGRKPWLPPQRIGGEGRLFGRLP